VQVPVPVPVLVVDDNQPFLDVVRTVLEERDGRFVVFQAATGADALTFLARQAPFSDAPLPALILLDFHLGDMNAPAVLRRLAGSAELRAIPVLVLTQADWDEDAVAALRAGATRFMVKPSRVQALHETVVGFWKEHVHGGTRPADRR
jgi:CheY-like chemotaxis protein